MDYPTSYSPIGQLYSPEGMASTSSSPSSSPGVSSTTGPGKKNKPKAGTVATKHPVQVQRRNARERKRVQQVNVGFVTLRNHIPVGQRNKKLSKVETLRQAAVYIAELQRVLGEESEVNLPQSIKQDPCTTFCYPSHMTQGPQFTTTTSPYYPMENYEPSNLQQSPNFCMPQNFHPGYSGGVPATMPSSPYYPTSYYCPPPLTRIHPAGAKVPISCNNSSTSPDSSYVSENSSYADLNLDMENSKVFQGLPSNEIELYMRS